MPHANNESYIAMVDVTSASLDTTANPKTLSLSIRPSQLYRNDAAFSSLTQELTGPGESEEGGEVSAETFIPLENVIGFPTSGSVQIDTETISYTGKTHSTTETTTSSSAVNSSAVVPVADTSGITSGFQITGTGISSTVLVESVDSSTQVTLDSSISIGNNTTLTFSSPAGNLTGATITTAHSNGAEVRQTGIANSSSEAETITPIDFTISNGTVMTTGAGSWDLKSDEVAPYPAQITSNPTAAISYGHMSVMQLNVLHLDPFRMGNYIDQIIKAFAGNITQSTIEQIVTAVGGNGGSSSKILTVDTNDNIVTGMTVTNTSGNSIGTVESTSGTTTVTLEDAAEVNNSTQLIFTLNSFSLTQSNNVRQTTTLANTIGRVEFTTSSSSNVIVDTNPIYSPKLSSELKYPSTTFSSISGTDMFVADASDFPNPSIITVSGGNGGISSRTVTITDSSGFVVPGMMVSGSGIGNGTTDQAIVSTIVSATEITLDSPYAITNGTNNLTIGGGAVQINNEIITYQQININDNVLQKILRAQYGTTNQGTITNNTPVTVFAGQSITATYGTFADATNGGIITIGTGSTREEVQFTQLYPNNNLKLIGITRGINSTTPRSHANDTTISYKLVTGKFLFFGMQNTSSDNTFYPEIGNTIRNAAGFGVTEGSIFTGTINQVINYNNQYIDVYLTPTSGSSKDSFGNNQDYIGQLNTGINDTANSITISFSFSTYADNWYNAFINNSLQKVTEGGTDYGIIKIDNEIIYYESFDPSFEPGEGDTTMTLTGCVRGKGGGTLSQNNTIPAAHASGANVRTGFLLVPTAALPSFTSPNIASKNDSISLNTFGFFSKETTDTGNSPGNSTTEFYITGESQVSDIRGLSDNGYSSLDIYLYNVTTGSTVSNNTVPSSNYYKLNVNGNETSGLTSVPTIDVAITQQWGGDWSGSLKDGNDLNINTSVGANNYSYLSGVNATDMGLLPSNFDWYITVEATLRSDLVPPPTENYTVKVLSATNNCLGPNTLIPKVLPKFELKSENFEKEIEYVKVSTIRVGDIIRTDRGDLTLSKVMKSDIVFKSKFVKFEKDCLGYNLPSDDIYFSHDHPLSLGYFKTENINNGIPDKTQDEEVYVFIECKYLVDKIRGITEEVSDFDSQYNLIFDKQACVNTHNLDCLTHHPIQNQRWPHNPKLIEDEFHDKSVSRKESKPFLLTFDKLIKYKPEHMGLKEFLAKCLTYDKSEKFKFDKISPNDNRFKNYFNYNTV